MFSHRVSTYKLISKNQKVQLLKIILSGYQSIQIWSSFIGSMKALEDSKLPDTICSQPDNQTFCLNSPSRAYSNPVLVQLLAQTQGIVCALLRHYSPLLR